jgi:hypothetical protein
MRPAIPLALVMRRTGGESLPVRDSLASSELLASTSPRDGVFGLLGLMDIRMKVGYLMSANEVSCEATDISIKEVALDQWIS